MRRPRLLLLYFTFLSLISLAASPGAIYAQVTATWSGGGRRRRCFFPRG